MARRMLNDARVTVLGRSGTDITTISAPTRTIPARLRRWVERAYPRCGHAGCTADQHLQIDHIIPIEDQGPTSKENLWRLCTHHHKLKTFYGWHVTEDQHGIRRLVPPDQPDYPDRGPP
jgi:5-methylcytosine-specific restriction endonuclease McrA